MMSLRIGSHGGAVSALQRDLDRIGIPCKADGLFGPNTKKAVEKLQTAVGLPATGELDDASRVELDKLCAMCPVAPAASDSPARTESPAPPAPNVAVTDSPTGSPSGAARLASGVKGVNRSMPVGPQVERLVAAGYRFALRFVNLAGRHDLPEIEEPEVRQIRAAGVALSLTQMFRTTGVAAEQGRSDGLYMAEAAGRLGFPRGEGIVLWWDLESTIARKGKFWGVDGRPVSREEMMDLLDGWAQAVIAGGYAAGMYCGPQNHLSSADLTALSSFTSFWKAGTTVVGPERGYQLVQAPGDRMIAGININENVVTEDALRQLPVFWAGEATR